jgi:hypothetical protein
MQEKSLSKSRSGFGVGSFRDGALDPGIVGFRGTGVRASDSLNAGHSLGRVEKREVGTNFQSCFSSINRWCTNVMLARADARDRAQKSRGPHSGFMFGHGLAEAVTRGPGRDLHPREHV